MATLAEDIGVSEGALQEAVSLGMIRLEPAGNGDATLPAAEREYILHAWPLLCALRSALQHEPDVRFALLFGSMSRGEEHEGSDVDLAVELRKPTLERIIRLEMRLSEAVDRSVEVMRLKDALSSSSLLEDIAESGRVLIDRDYMWSTLCSRLPKLIVARQREERRRLHAGLAAIDELLAR